MVHAIRKPVSGRGGGEGGLSLSSEATLVPPAEAHSRRAVTTEQPASVCSNEPRTEGEAKRDTERSREEERREKR